MENNIKFNQELWDKVMEYCLITASGVLANGSGQQRCIAISEEATSGVILRLYNNPPEIEKDLDGYLFIAAKNAVYGVIKKHLGAKKRDIWKDSGNIGLDIPYNRNISLELPDYSDIEMAAKLDYDEDMDNKVQLIINTLQENEWISEFDIEVFVMRFIDNMYIKDIAKVLGSTYQKVQRSSSKVKNILNHLNK